MQAPPRWSRWREVPAVCFYPRNLRSCLVVALVVGTVLMAINQLDVVVSGHATPAVWLKIGLTYLVPFMVSNYGILVATHGRAAA
ncbi:MAG TPA: nitrate/nitrite transporter NrtS [Candidatus Acidoferrales bacterium]|nr:nitrate/nitrite transporter NrtS [Candidatus Acidoferrales bacterium]